MQLVETMWMLISHATDLSPCHLIIFWSLKDILMVYSSHHHMKYPRS